MGLLDGGIARVFGGVFGAIYPDAMLHRKVRGVEDAGGTVRAVFTGDGGQAAATMVKAQRDTCTQSQREQEGYADKDVRFLILTQYDGIGLPEPETGSHLTFPAVGGTRYSLEGEITLDAAGSHWTARGREVPHG